jgi:hypothetical protein
MRQTAIAGLPGYSYTKSSERVFNPAGKELKTCGPAKQFGAYDASGKKHIVSLASIVSGTSKWLDTRSEANPAHPRIMPKHIPTQRFYPNLETSHSDEKVKLLPKLFYRGDFDAMVIIGAQANEGDVRLLVLLAKTQGIPLYCIDARKDQLDKLKKDFKYGKYLLMDASNIDVESNFYLMLKETGAKNPFVYDNLCGGPKRIPNIKNALNWAKQVVFYTHSRHGTHFKLQEEFKADLYPLGSKRNYLAVVHN